MTFQFEQHFVNGATPVVASARAGGSPRGFYRSFAKRVMDVTLVLLAAPPVLLIVGVLALIIALNGGAPFYMQERIGRKGRVFRMVKLRTMVWNADSVLETYLSSNPDARIEWDRDQKLRHDPRVTWFGAMLRRTSLDELPQLWNVFTGDMSIVGPRPMMVNQKSLYPGIEYYEMRPGITGFWQISARNEASFSQRAMFDRSYFINLSLRTDIWVMFRTIGVMARGTGY